MTGLLHRLAQRATGNAWAVRPDLRLPLGAQGPDRPQDDTAPPLIETPAPPGDAPARPRPPGPDWRVAAAPEQPALPPLVPSPRADAAHARVRPPEPEAAATHTPQARTSPVQPPGPAAVPATARPAMASRHAPAHPAPTPGRRGEEPAPLLPPQPGAAGRTEPLARAVRGPAAPALRTAPQAAAGQDTEVHIHIGRIEVTALQEASRPRARPRERTPAVSLDAYLATRRKP